MRRESGKALSIRSSKASPGTWTSSHPRSTVGGVRGSWSWAGRAILGPVLIRGARLDGESPVAFGSASGRNGELRLPAGRWDELKGPVNVWGQTIQPRPRLRVAVVDVWAKAGGCYGLQVDGGSFSYRIVFHGAWQP